MIQLSAPTPNPAGEQRNEQANLTRWERHTDVILVDFKVLECLNLIIEIIAADLIDQLIAASDDLTQPFENL